MSQRRNMWGPAWGSLVVLNGVALVAAYLMQDSGWLSLTPPASATDPNPVPDVLVGEAFPLYLSAFTAWVSLLLLIPAYARVRRRLQSAQAWDTWSAFWTISYVAYLIHLAVSAFLFFNGDFAWMTHTTRVSAFWPGMLIAVWWGIDVLLLAAADRGVVTLQRIALHVLVFILFVGGSVVTGETMMIKIMGAALLLVGAVAAIRAVMGRSGKEGADGIPE